MIMTIRLYIGIVILVGHRFVFLATPEYRAFQRWRTKPQHRRTCRCSSCKAVIHGTVRHWRLNLGSASRLALSWLSWIRLALRWLWSVDITLSPQPSLLPTITNPPVSSFVFARWQHRTDDNSDVATAYFAVGSTPKYPLSLEGQTAPSTVSAK